MWHYNYLCTLKDRAAVGMGIPMGMGMGWVWGLKFNPHGSPAKGLSFGFAFWSISRADSYDSTDILYGTDM